MILLCSLLASYTSRVSRRLGCGITLRCACHIVLFRSPSLVLSLLHFFVHPRERWFAFCVSATFSFPNVDFLVKLSFGFLPQTLFTHSNGIICHLQKVQCRRPAWWATRACDVRVAGSPQSSCSLFSSSDLHLCFQPYPQPHLLKHYHDLAWNQYAICLWSLSLCHIRSITCPSVQRQSPNSTQTLGWQVDIDMLIHSLVLPHHERGSEYREMHSQSTVI